MGLIAEFGGSCLLFLLVFGMSGTVEIKSLQKQIRNAKALCIGLAMQFLVSPLIGFLVVKIFRLPAETGIMILVITTSPGGSYSNWWCSLFNAELALSVRAALHRHPEIAIGNIIGSNVFNLLCVLGIAGLVDPIKVPTEAITRDIWAMVAITILTYPLMRSRYSISRPEGALLLVIYFGYAIFVFFASNNAAAP